MYAAGRPRAVGGGHRIRLSCAAEDITGRPAKAPVRPQRPRPPEIPTTARSGRTRFGRLHHLRAVQVRQFSPWYPRKFRTPGRRRMPATLNLQSARTACVLSVFATWRNRVFAAPAGDDVERLRGAGDADGMAAGVAPVEAHHACDRLEVGTVVTLRHRDHDGVVLPARSAEIRGSGDLQDVAVPLMVVQDACVRHAGGPGREHVTRGRVPES